MKIKLMKDNIYYAYWDHTKGYVTTVEHFLVYLQRKEYNFALNSAGSIIWNYIPNPEWSYFEIKGIKLWKLIREQPDEVIEWFYKLIR